MHDTHIESASVNVASLGAAARYVLRVAPNVAARVGEEGGFDLGGAINSVRVSGALLSARLGPDEWLLLGPNGEAEALAQRLEQVLGGEHYALVDVSHRNVAITVSGRSAAAVLNAGVPIDLDDAIFPSGSATRTVLGKAEIVLMRAGAEPFYRVECWRSFAPYVRSFIDEAARNLGGG